MVVRAVGELDRATNGHTDTTKISKTNLFI
jgi:hypothetical protein